jgi:hypothetical protein
VLFCTYLDNWEDLFRGEKAARKAHFLANRRGKPIQALGMTGFPRMLVAREFFHEKI